MKHKTISETLACEGLTMFLQSLSMIDDDQEVTGITKAPNALDLKIEKVEHND
jgi:hypothetical protein